MTNEIADELRKLLERESRTRTLTERVQTNRAFKLWAVKHHHEILAALYSREVA